MDLDFFEGVIQSEVQVGTYTIRYPVFYRDVSYMSVFLLASLEKVKNILPSKRMNPFRLTPWQSMITITASEYKDSDIGQYNQVSVGVPFFYGKLSPVFTGILSKPPEIPMIYTLFLPVTTKAACETGIKMANYPEFLADIRFENLEQWINCNADADGENILKLSGRKIKLVHTPRQQVCPVTLKQDHLLRSEFNFSEADAGISKNPKDVQIEFGNHPVGLKLKELCTGKVLQYQNYPSGKAILSMVSESYPI